ncbi:hypothetical protein T03_8518 [Trichinella britovi]|uniref:Uncharacterized protein n=3 Tax=Trichinella TaxID=6333 RepID=A0A0V1CS15_TRIBR|nr:hypothetical protein T05_12335 [Trichinella murrelli]KRX65743.1 hypothetical protein T09_6213 [Trichinella sp. T9]KRY19860.1 hypothetical protein T12_3927 [Trichinella patagoniensis]KRY52007.1 hypothetical protein T03_8518 [Trichinella britovi]KRZ90480.1 hypothetical protein T08_1981 [Trichinella sp. T8]
MFTNLTQVPAMCEINIHTCIQQLKGYFSVDSTQSVNRKKLKSGIEKWIGNRVRNANAIRNNMKIAVG